MTVADLESTAHAIVADGKGLLAADESFGTIEKRLKAVGLPSTEQIRRDYREMLFRTRGVGEFIGGVILFDETIRQKAEDGTPLVRLIEHQKIIPGIKVDKGAKPLAGAPGEKVTEGLDGLRDRLNEYRELGARFTKWRAVITIGDQIPSTYCVAANAHALGRFAALSQEAGLVPIVEPEVLMDGNHDIERCFKVTEYTLHTVFQQLVEQRVVLERMLLKPNMVLPGKESKRQVGDEVIAEQTVACLERTVPSAVPGIVFLSGGMSDEEATSRLSAMNAMGPHPWTLSFSYGRALQAQPMKIWAADRKKNAAEAQRAFYHRAKMNGAAARGAWRPEMEKRAA